MTCVCVCVVKEELSKILLNVCSLYINTNAVSPSLRDSDESSRATTTECQAEFLEAVLGDSGMLLCMLLCICVAQLRM